MLIWTSKNWCSNNAKRMSQGDSRTALNLIICKAIKYYNIEIRASVMTFPLFYNKNLVS